MGKTQSSGLDPFSSFDIESIEKEIGMLLPGSGEPVKEKAEEEKITKKPAFGGLDLTQKIQIPETEEEAKDIGDKFLIDVDASGEIAAKEKQETGEEEEETDTGEEDATITEDSPLYLHAATLHEEGILPTLDLESLKGKKYSEALETLLDEQKKYIENGRNEYKESLTKRQKEFLDLIEKGIPQEQVEHQFSIEDSYGKITNQLLADDPELQEQIVIQNLKLKGLTDKKIQVFVDAAKEKEVLYEEAKEAKEEIDAYIANQKEVMIRKADEEERESERREKELQKSIKATIDSTSEILPGMKLSAADKTKLYELMTKPVEERVVNGQRVPISIIGKAREEDPITFNLRLIYYIQQGFFNKDFDLSKVSKKMTSSAASKLAMKLKEEIAGPAGKGLTVQKKKETKPESIIFPTF